MKSKSWTPEKRKSFGEKIRVSWARKRFWKEKYFKAQDGFFLLKQGR